MEDSESTEPTASQALLPANAPTYKHISRANIEHDPLAHDMNMPSNTTSLSWTATMDRTVLGISILLVIFATLMIVNGVCSRSTTLLTSWYAVCVGGHLSVQSWLVITGLELSLLTLLILPRTYTILTSKYLTRRLTSTGLPLSTVLNSQTTAPFLTLLLHGHWGLKSLRFALLALAAVTTVLYKYTFTPVISDSILQAYSSGNIGRDFTNDPLRRGAPPYFGPGPADHGFITSLGDGSIASIYNQNLRDALAGCASIVPYNTFSYLPNIDDWPAGEHIFGPSVDVKSAVPKLLYGNATFCHLVDYTRNFVNILYWNESEGSAIPSPLPADSLLRVSKPVGLLDNAIYYSVNDADFDFVDIQQDANSTVRFSYGLLNETQYRWRASAQTQYCWGYASWSNIDPNGDSNSWWVSEGISPLLTNPRDVRCINEAFDFVAWNSSTGGGQFAKRFLEGLTTGWFTMETPWWLGILSYLVVLATKNHTASYLEMLSLMGNGTEGQWSPWGLPNGGLATPACFQAWNASQNRFPSILIASGVVEGAGTGMTRLGIGVQAFAALMALVAIGVVVGWRQRGLVGEWAAQWVGLLDGVEKEEIDGTSVGMGAVRGGTGPVWLKSENVEGSNDVKKLALGKKRGVVDYGSRHL
jgi:hypothetical protein